MSPGSLLGYDADPAMPPQNMPMTQPTTVTRQSGLCASADAVERRSTVRFSDDGQPERPIPSQDQRGRRNTKNLLKQAAANMGQQVKSAVVVASDAPPGARSAW